ncbi:MAG: NUDIX hydrolase [Anaerolineae bacterium]|nr:NUDIX hydrolase [Anaerolineae bacterium]
MADITTQTQVSAGGVVFRAQGTAIEIAVIGVEAKGEERWQLPKGIVGANEEPEETALREVREETGLRAETVAPLETIEYWYVGRRGDRRIRYHKFVHFYLMRYLSGDVADHDHEVTEARWVDIDEAARMLTFKSEREVVLQSAGLLGHNTV